MGFIELILLGAIAGFTIFLGLPVALMNATGKTKGMLNALAIGILFFLLVDVMQDAMSFAQKPVIDAFNNQVPLLSGLLFPLVLLFGLGMGLLGLVWFEKRYIKSEQKTQSENRAKHLALMIAVGIGLHNFSEGLAIGQSYSAGVINLALTLVIGFGLHNMTEGFGIAAPLSGHKIDWKYLALLGLIGGGPTFLGAIVGSFWTSNLLSVLFLSLAGGAIIYVVKELLYHGKIQGEDIITMACLVIGFMLGFLTLVLVHFWVG